MTHLSCVLLMTSGPWNWGFVASKALFGQQKPWNGSWKDQGFTSCEQDCTQWTRSCVKQEHQIPGTTVGETLIISEHLRIATNKAIQCRTILAILMPNICGARQAKRRIMASVVHSKLLYPVLGKGPWELYYPQKTVIGTERIIISEYQTMSTSAVLVLASVSPINLL